MPIYEYRCRKCGSTFARDMSIADHDRLASLLVRPDVVAMQASHEIDDARCPTCHDFHVDQQLGAFFAKTSRKS